MQTILKIVVPVPVRGIFDYLPPDDLPSEQYCPGMRFSVPFGPHRKTGVLLALAKTTDIDSNRLKKAERCLDSSPLLSPPDLELMLWASRYYHHPVGEVVLTAFPVLLRQGRPATIAFEALYIATEKSAGKEGVLPKNAHRQQALLNALRTHPAGLKRNQLDALGWNWQPAFRELRTKGLVEKCTDRATGPGEYAYTAPDYELNEEQNNAVSSLCENPGHFSISLLDGITGSGKTEVYFQLIHRVLEQKKQVMVLLPEITLTPQLEERFAHRFNTRICVFHSGLNDETRKNSWLLATRGDAGILLGTRSCVFTPMKNPGLIVLDEEHDTSFKQQEGFRFSARDVAIKRAQLLDIPVLLGSATPSLESLFNIRRKRYRHLRLRHRTGHATLPSVQALDIRKQAMTEGLSARLLQQIGRTLKQGDQVLLFVNRRGYAPTLICHDCGWVAQCTRCDSNLVLHSLDQCLRCHHCGSQQTVHKCCPECGDRQLVALGLGTERIEQILEKIFPDAGIARIDRDNTRRKGSLEAMMADIRARRSNLLVGTQMLAKGHHFADVTLVGILDTDSGLFSADFRTSERLAQLIVQVSGRAGRESKPGRVILQTRHPEHPFFNSLITRGYAGFAEELLDERRACELPPFIFQALLRAESNCSESPPEFLDRIRTDAESAAQDPVMFLGPVPAPMPRKAGRYRFQLLIQSRNRKNLHIAINRMLSRIPSLAETKRVKWSLDIDPVDLF